jgi:seryl-tRNA synthetase
MTELEKLQAQRAELEKQIKELKRQEKVLEKQAIKKNYVGYEYKKLSGRTDDTLFHTIYLNRPTSDALLGQEPSHLPLTLSGKPRKQKKLTKVSLAIARTKEEMISLLEEIIAELNQLLNEIKNIAEDDNKKSAPGAGNT